MISYQSLLLSTIVLNDYELFDVLAIRLHVELTGGLSAFGSLV